MFIPASSIITSRITPIAIHTYGFVATNFSAACPTFFTASLAT